MTSAVQVSVVLVPTLWSEELLRAVVASSREAFGDVTGEILVSVHDTAETSWLEQLAAELACVPVLHETDSHAAAVNSAVAAASGHLALVLDEDVLLPQRAIATAVEKMRALDDADVAWLERRESASVVEVDELVDLVAQSSRRYLESSPRAIWNRGGAFLVRRELFLRLRGYDERPAFATHGAADFMVRASAAGAVVEWLTGPQVAAYHFPTRCPAGTLHGAEGDHTRRARQEFVGQDRSIYRNLIEWSVPSEQRPVLVSVAISTRDRAELIPDSINSVLAQTFAEFEIVIVDDGSEDDSTRAVVEAFDDPRVRYVRTEPGGISAARNRAADESVGFFTAVHDDDDIMLPWRLETSLAALTGDIDATYGAWVNFDDETAAMVLHITREFTQELLAFNGQGPGHATWLLPTHLIRTFRYDETLSSSVDHNLASRLMWSGVRWHHTGKVLFIRRVHSRQVSAVDSGRQRSAAFLTRFAALAAAAPSGRRTLRKDAANLKYPEIPEKARLFGAFGPYLPDHLVRRTGLIVNNVTNKVIAMDRYDGVDYMMAEQDLQTGRLKFEFAEVSDITWPDLVRLRANGVVGVKLGAVRRQAADVDQAAADLEVDFRERAASAVRRRLNELIADLAHKGKSPAWLIGFGEGLRESEIELLGSPERALRLSAASDEGSHFRINAIGYGYFEDALAAMHRLGEAVSEGRLLYLDTSARPTVSVHQQLASIDGKG